MAEETTAAARADRADDAEQLAGSDGPKSRNILLLRQNAHSFQLDSGPCLTFGLGFRGLLQVQRTELVMTSFCTQVLPLTTFAYKDDSDV